MQSWVSTTKKLYTGDSNNSGVEHLLNNSYTKIESVPGLKTSLFPHQKTIVKAMIDLEMNRSYNIPILYDGDNATHKLKTTSGVLSEAVGSGKTIDILSVILLQKIPKVYPDISELNLFNRNSFNGWDKNRV
jgi:hypothetical protein